MSEQDPLAPSIHDLLRPHADVLLDQAELHTIGQGWTGIVRNLLAAWAVEVRRTPGARLRVAAVRERLGKLHVICDAAPGLPPGRLDLHEVRHLQRTAEVASLRTCDRCGSPGMLRGIGGAGLATRCAAHADEESGRPTPVDAYLPGEAMSNLLASHEDWLASDEAVVDVPRGWLTIATEFLARASGLPAAGDASLELLVMIPVCGRLEIRIAHDLDILDDIYRLWRDTVMAVADAAFFTCDVCGRDGRIRRTREGVPTPRCDAHADVERWRSQQHAGLIRTQAPLLVISSARPQWTLAALRVAALPIRAAAEAPYAGEADGSVPIYEMRSVAAALGLAHEHRDGDGDDDRAGLGASPADTEQQARLRRIINRGDAGRWRRLARPSLAMVDRLDALAGRAPNLLELTSLIRRHLLAAFTMKLAIRLPPILVVGPPGVGKTWMLTGLAEVLGVPFRDRPLSGASHADAIGGSHGAWRNSSAGLVAKTLISEAVANPLIFVDEFDKASSVGGEDMYQPFYSLLEPAGAKRFVDAYLTFPMDASHVLWVLAANSTAPIPLPILDRLLVVTVDPPDEGQLAVVARSVYADCNTQRNGFFPEEPSPALLRRLADMGPRRMRIAIEDAMTTAASDGRDEVQASDVRDRQGAPRPRIGFV